MLINILLSELRISQGPRFTSQLINQGIRVGPGHTLIIPYFTTQAKLLYHGYYIIISLQSPPAVPDGQNQGQTIRDSETSGTVKWWKKKGF